ncbi:MAG: tRNA dihydrouridine synthase DusB [Candidatus Omnitrophica bacterium]|nr:tRNA dihydrouridine synthase DusB [Candidatus Omnitrophota bacterium]
MKLANYELIQPLFLAPMEDITDLPFRLVCKRLGCDVTVTEFTAAEALIRNIPRAVKKITICEEERPVGIQLFGSRPDALKEAAAFAQTLAPDFIDINCGCWVKNHVARTEGAGLLKDLPLFEKLVKATVSGTKLPVTVKTRLGWDQNSIVIMDVAKMVEQAGAKMLTVHCRTRSQAHRGLADWSWLERIKKAISIPLIGNGDINSPQDVKAMLETGCDGVMIGRGAVANPWIFQQAKHYLTTGQFLPEPSVEEKIKLCIEHLAHSCREKSCRNPVMTFRKHYVGYLKGLPGISKLRHDLMTMETFEAVRDRLHQFMIEKTKTMH